ncbi:MAG TPA: methyltransferase domain-containing protein [Longimicrobium sp.]|nr:methyltransferase domain-containing protein [Longimicrobium sp.]
MTAGGAVSPYARSAELYDAVYAWKDYAAEAEALHGIIQEHLRSGGNRLLDVACGSGRHLAHLAEHYRVAGVDLDPTLLEMARRAVPAAELYAGDMTSFDLGRRFDAVTCLFSAIGYMRTEPRLRQAVANLARHLEPGGVMVVEPWLAREVVRDRYLHLDVVDGPDLKVARGARTLVEGDGCVLEFSYLVLRPDGPEHFVERHELGLFTVEQTLDAFRAAGLDPIHDPHGLAGRGLYVATRPRA